MRAHKTAISSDNKQLSKFQLEIYWNNWIIIDFYEDMVDEAEQESCENNLIMK